MNGGQMINEKSKNIAGKVIATPKVGLDSVNLRQLPKYLCYRASLLRDKMTLQYVLALVIAAWTIQYTVDRFSDNELMKRYRQKEFILAPSNIVGFTPARPQGVPESYVDDAANTFMGHLGNVNPANIEENYKLLAKYMSSELKIQFQAEVNDWIKTVKEENVSEILKVMQKEIIIAEGGHYKLTALARRERYVSSEYLGHSDEVITMRMKLMPPKEERQWHLQIYHLT
ncbi:MAG: hypothetical protein COT73_11205, partial [Bdellovibrio sp. CG10_big_fil_rev_8_21_14_0_10_47_8]